MRDAVAIGGNASPKDDPANVMRYKSAAAKRAQAHRWRKQLGAAMPDNSGHQPHAAPSDQHRLPIPGEQ
jgi:hypothetical protein